MIRLACLALTVVTGMTALVYQVAWHKYLAALLGSHSEATVVVLAIFLGGLSSGYAAFGWLSRRLVEGARSRRGSPRLLLAYGIVEGGIGLYALVFPWLFLAARSVSLLVPAGADLGAFTLDVLLAAVLIGPPAVLMGGTVPLLTQALATGPDDATRFHALVYGFNTAGAFAGALAGGFAIVPHLGLDRAVQAMGAINVVAGLLLVVLDRSARRPDVAPAAFEPAGPDPARPPLSAFAAALLSGAAMLTLQVVVNRIAAFSFGSSPFTFSMVVATFVSCIAIGSFAVSALPRIPALVLPCSQWALAAYLLLLGPALADAPYWAHVVRSVFRDDPAAFVPFWLTVLVLMLVVFVVPLALSGALLPLLFDRLRRETGTLGRVAGRLYSWNTVGSLVGALAGGYVLLIWLDLHDIYRLCIAAVAVTAALLSLPLPGGRRVAFGGLAASALALALLPAWAPERLASGAFNQRRPTAASYAGADAFFARYLVPGLDVAFYEDDPVASIAVLDIPNPPGPTIRALVSNGKNDSALPGDHRTTGLLGLLPALVAEKCERVFVIGYGTGKTAGELATLESVREIVVAEISRGVIHAAPLFESLNERALGSGKLRMVRGDAFRTLQRSGGGFDVVVSAPSNPWVTGVESLYTREFLTAARQRLAPGGAFVQWIQGYDLDVATLDIVLATVRDVFGSVAVWHGEAGDLMLLAFAEPGRGIDLDRLIERWNRADYRAAAARSGLPDLPAFLAHEILPFGVVHAQKLPGELHTLLRPVLNHRAARAFFAGEDANVPPGIDRTAAEAGARNSVVRRVMPRVPPELREGFRAGVVEETCAREPVRCATLLAEWQRDAPGSTALADTLERIGRTAAATAVTPVVLSKLVSLFDASGTAGAPGEPAVVQRIAETFETYYHHAAPFDAEALRGPLRRCTAAECEPLRLRVADWGVSPVPPPAR